MEKQESNLIALKMPNGVGQEKWPCPLRRQEVYTISFLCLACNACIMKTICRVSQTKWMLLLPFSISLQCLRKIVRSNRSNKQLSKIITWFMRLYTRLSGSKWESNLSSFVPSTLLNLSEVPLVFIPSCLFPSDGLFLSHCTHIPPSIPPDNLWRTWQDELISGPGPAAAFKIATSGHTRTG